MESVLKVVNLKKDGILYGITFELKEGEMVAIMGPSGSGKSTLLYNVAGMDQPDGGEVWLKEKEISALDEDGKARLRLENMGFVFQQMNMVNNLNLIDNILFPALQGNHRKAAIAAAKTEKARQLMEKMSIQDLAQRKISEVSGGQLQRACICRSLMNDPHILFADEPTGALNQSAAGQVMEQMDDLHQEGMTILLVTHDHKIAAHCDRVLYLLDGQIQKELVFPENLPRKKRETMLSKWLAEMGW